MKKIIFLSLIILLSGCTNYYTTEEPVVNVNNYLNSNITTYDIKIVDLTIDCLNGSCPSVTFNSNINTKECFFCDSNYTGVRNNKFHALIGMIGGMDAFVGCATNYLQNDIDGDFPIVSKNDTSFTINVTIMGNVKQSGNCDEIYEYNYVRIEQWIFNK